MALNMNLIKSFATGGGIGGAAGVGGGAAAAGLTGGGTALGLLGPIGLGLMGFGAALNAFSALKQGKEIEKYLKEQAAELERKARFEERMNLENQLLVTEQAGLTLGKEKAQAAKAGVRVGSGSPVTFREATLARYEQQKRLMGLVSMEKQNELYVDATQLRKKASQVRSGSKWKAFADILGGGGQMGLSAYDMGLFGA